MNKLGSKHSIFLAVTVMMLLSMFFVFDVKAQEENSSNIIRIREDGTVEGTDKIQRNEDVYKLTGNIESSVQSGEAFIFVEKNNIILDGAGYILQGKGYGTAIYMRTRQNVVIKNLNIKGFEVGINFGTINNYPSDSKFWGLQPATNNQILDNTINYETGYGIFLKDTENTLISGNVITAQDPKGGIYISPSSTNTSLFNNQFFSCHIHIKSESQTVGLNNTVDGTPLVILNGESNQVIESARLVYLLNCENMTIKNIEMVVDYGQSIWLLDTRNTEVTNCEGYITLINSDNNNIYDNYPKIIELSNSNNNTIHNNYPKIIELSGSSFNKIFLNRIVEGVPCVYLHSASNYNEIFGNILLKDSNTEDSPIIRYDSFPILYSGIQIGGHYGGVCQYNNVYWNKIVNQNVGIDCVNSFDNKIHSNLITESWTGIKLYLSGQNLIFENNVTECGWPVGIVASDNVFYRNNFVDNEYRVSIEHKYFLDYDIIVNYSVNNTFDSGELLGGNYWSDYDGVDADGNGVGDTPVIINEDSKDNYPLMTPFSITVYDISFIPNRFPESQDTEFLILLTALIGITTVSSIGILVYFKKYKK